MRQNGSRMFNKYSETRIYDPIYALAKHKFYFCSQMMKNGSSMLSRVLSCSTMLFYPFFQWTTPTSTPLSNLVEQVSRMGDPIFRKKRGIF